VAAAIRASLQGPGGPDSIDFSAEPGDPGLAGPDSPTWRVHAEFPSMIVGGVSALLLQTLHPLAMAGVAQHSDYRADPYGRLRRTAAFIASTTFAARAVAERHIARVRSVHLRVTGTAPDGRHYEASDPDLLCWVHTAEVWSFLRAYQRFSDTPLSDADCDRYLADTAAVARALGAAWVPTTTAEVRAYWKRMQPQLYCGPQAAETVTFLLQLPAAGPPEWAANRLIQMSAIGVLPGWAATMLGLDTLATVEPFATRAASHALFATMRWALGPNEVAAQAFRRTQAVRAA
jgi:uncharacterized protein (DUF2236 family)